MDVICFTNPNSAFRMEQAVLVNGITSKMWIERYDSAGEFTFTAPASSNLRDLLPIGSFVTHIDSTDIMIVENHEIQDQTDQEPQIVVTGRGLETYFEQRIVGSNKAMPASGTIGQYSLAADYLANQIVTLIQSHILAADLIDVGNAMDFLTIMTDVGAVGPNVVRSVNRGDLYSAILSLLPIGPYGIRVVRPGFASPLGLGGNPNTAVVIHQGTDLSKSIIFSVDTGEIINADYLWSNKKLKNAAYISGQWVETTVVPADTGYSRRWMMIDATDIDQSFTAAPAGTDLANVVAAMQQRGHDILASQVDVSLTKAEVKPNTTNAAYRKDFNVGDIITVNGAYNDSSKMRISEYAETEDESGSSGYPTLALV